MRATFSAGWASAPSSAAAGPTARMTASPINAPEPAHEGVGLIDLEHGQWIRGRAGPADHAQGRDHQHEVVALLLGADFREWLEERVVEQRHAVREDGGVHGPRDVVADRQMIEHVPDQDAHVVIAQEWQAGDVKARTLLLGRREWAAVRPLRILGLPRLAPGIDADRVAGLEP